MATLSQYMLSSAATFSFFLAIGSVRLSSKSSRVRCVLSRLPASSAQVIRTDALMPPHMEALLAQQRRPMPPIIHSRASGADIIRARWEAEKQKQKQRPL